MATTMASHQNSRRRRDSRSSLRQSFYSSENVTNEFNSLHIACIDEAAATTPNSHQKTAPAVSSETRTTENNQHNIRSLLKKDPNNASQRNKWGSIPLHFASNPDTTKRLLDVYPDGLYVKDDTGSLPLHDAVRRSDCDVVRMLLGKEGEGGSAVFVRNDRNESPLSIAIRCVVTGQTLVCLDNDDDIVARPWDNDEQKAWETLGIVVKSAFYHTRCNNGNGEKNSKDKSFLFLHAILELFNRLLSRPSHASQSTTHNISPTANTASNTSYFDILNVINLAIRHHPHQLHMRDSDGRLPLHVFAASQTPTTAQATTKMEGEPSHYPSNQNILNSLLHPKHGNHQAACEVDGDGRLPLHIAIATGWNFVYDTRQNEDSSVLQVLVEASPEALMTRDPITGLYPFMLAAAAESDVDDTHRDRERCRVDTIYRLLREDPTMVVVEDGRINEKSSL